jgi:eukaryotic-like serine/threonine-protein kinase
MAEQPRDTPDGTPTPGADLDATLERSEPTEVSPTTPESASPGRAGRPTSKVRNANIGGFQVLRRLGAGAMGTVFHARHLRSGREVALKLLSRDLAHEAAFLERFQREARIQAQLNHLHVVRCFGAGAARGRHFLAMEYVGGGSLQTWLDRLGKLTLGDAVHVVLACARALECAHELNVIHRDVKPANLLLTPEGLVKLADLGLAKALDDLSLTQTGTSFGTPAYMAPEQAVDAKRVDGRSDVYSLGCMFYRLLAGRRPFEGNSVVELLQAKDAGFFLPLRSLAPETPEVLAKIVHTMIARQPDQRYQSCTELIGDLEWQGLANPTLSFFFAGPGQPAQRARLKELGK